jgi:uncharacterized membrane protein
MKKIRLIAYLGVSIALYVVLGILIKIPLIGHIGTDLGYIAFGFTCFAFGWPAAIVGIVGCMFESLLVSGWIPIGWMIGQAVIGLMCGYFYNHSNNKTLHIIITVIAIFIGVGLIKTGIECVLYQIPLVVKIPKNMIAFVADTVPMLVGLWIGYGYKKVIIKEQV